MSNMARTLQIRDVGAFFQDSHDFQLIVDLLIRINFDPLSCYMHLFSLDGLMMFHAFPPHNVSLASQPKFIKCISASDLRVHFRDKIERFGRMSTDLMQLPNDCISAWIFDASFRIQVCMHISLFWNSLFACHERMMHSSHYFLIVHCCYVIFRSPCRRILGT